jgi:amino acid adenylation domain-containing protein
MNTHNTPTDELSPSEKRAKLAQLLQQKANQPPTTFPLSPGQQALWFIYRLAPESWAYNVVFSARICSPVDIPTLKAAFQVLTDRHPALRTNYTTDRDTPVQQVRASAEVCFIATDAAGWSDDRLHHELTSAAQTPFDLETEPVFRVSLYTRSSTEHVLLLVAHHIAIDLWSLTVLLDELRTIYADRLAGRPTQLPALDLQYADYVRWQAQTSLETADLYWQQQLAGELQPLNLPLDRSRPLVKNFTGASQTFELSPALTQQLKTLARAEEATLYVTLLAAFQVLLYRYSHQSEIVVCSPTAGRNQREYAGIVGYFVNSVILKSDLTDELTFQEFLVQVRGTVQAAIEHQNYPFSRLVERVRGDRSAQSSLFQVFFILQKLHRVEELSDFILPIDSDTQVDWGGLTLAPYSLPHQEGQFDLTLEAIDTGGTLKGIFKYDPDLFEPATIARTIDRFQTLLADIVAAPAQRISELTILPPTERQLLAEWNGTQTEDVRNPARLIHQLFESRVERHPDAIAVVFEAERLTYAALNARANQLAHHLQALGVEVGELVGLCVDRSSRSIVGILGILKAGGAYLPLDASNPADRLQATLRDAGVKVLVTEAALLTDLTCDRIVCLDRDLPTIAGYPITNLAEDGSVDRLAYVIYTSGSTGQPKGVAIDHANVFRLFMATDDWYRFNDRDVWTLFHSIAFDFSVWEIWGALLYGGRVVVVSQMVSRDPTAFYRLLGSEGVTVLNQTPSAFDRLMSIDEKLHSSSPLSLRLIIFGGEALNLASLEPWFDRHGDTYPQLVNMYGITETTVHVTYRPLTRADVRSSGSTIGRPIPDVRVYLLDAALQPVPIGVSGEMYVGGAGVARGYWQREELSKERFIANPFSADPAARLYKSGDLARYLPDGNLEYLGRIDTQVKIRGFRIELGEIEAVLSKCPEIVQSTVLVREDLPGDRTIVAYVVARDAVTFDRQQIRQFLRLKLPDYMVPSAFVVLAELPLTPNGKIDRRALPAPDRQRNERTIFVPPRNPLEQQLVQIWSHLLKIDAIGIEDDFFELGGHSLLATQVISRIQTVYSVSIPLRYMFEHPTIARFGTSIAPLVANYLSEDPDLEYEEGQI